MMCPSSNRSTVIKEVNNKYTNNYSTVNVVTDLSQWRTYANINEKCGVDIHHSAKQNIK